MMGEPSSGQHVSAVESAGSRDSRPAASAPTRRTVLALLGSVLPIGLLSLQGGCGGGGSSDSAEQGLPPVVASTWRAAWFAPQQDYGEVVALPVDPPLQRISLSNQTVRQVVRVSVAGTRWRIKLSNLFGAADVVIASARAARSTGPASIDTASDTALALGGNTRIVIPAGREIWTDAFGMSIAAQGELAVSFFVDQTAVVDTVHLLAGRLNLTATGDQAGVASLSGYGFMTSYYWLSAVDVDSADRKKVIVAFGDSITDGYGATVGAYRRWPDLLNQRLQSAQSTLGICSVVNAGISGNRWLNPVLGPSGISRFTRDVLDISAATHVLILNGINDIGIGFADTTQAVTADQLISAITQAISAAKARQLKVILCTLLPYAGSAYFDAAGEAKRQVVNRFIRSAANVDGVVDFDRTMSTAGNALISTLDGGDHLHPNDAGYQAMAQSIDLNLFA